jgi:hypothetical protein
VSSDFENRLWQQLEAAADRQVRSHPARKWTGRGRAILPRNVLRSALGVAAAGAIAAVMVSLVSRPEPPAVGHRQTQEFRLAGTQFSPGAITTAGSLWGYDIRARAILRIDPDSKRVLARIPAQGRWAGLALAAAPGVVWAVSAQFTGHDAPPANPSPVALLRIDPQDNRIVARVTLRAPDHSTIVPVGVVALPDAVWVWGSAGAQRIDPATNRVSSSIRVEGDSIRGFAADDAHVWVATELGRLVRFDARSGARLNSVPVTAGLRELVPVGDTLVVDRQDGVLVGLDATTGRTRWTTHLGSGVRDATVTGGRLWILTADSAGPNDRLVALDPDTGRIHDQVALPTNQGEALASLGPTLLATTSTGQVIVIHR